MLQIQDVGDGAPLHPHVSACYVGCGHDRPVECKVDGLAGIHVLVDAGDYPAVGHHAEAVGRRLLPEQEDHAVVKEWRLPAAVRIAQEPPAAVDVVGEGGTDVGRGMPIWMAWERHTGQLLRSITGMSHSEHHLTVVVFLPILSCPYCCPIFKSRPGMRNRMYCDRDKEGRDIHEPWRETPSRSWAWSPRRW